MKCECTFGSRAPATFSESAELSCAHALSSAAKSSLTQLDMLKSVTSLSDHFLQWMFSLTIFTKRSISGIPRPTCTVEQSNGVCAGCFSVTVVHHFRALVHWRKSKKFTHHWDCWKALSWNKMGRNGEQLVRTSKAPLPSQASYSVFPSVNPQKFNLWKFLQVSFQHGEKLETPVRVWSPDLYFDLLRKLQLCWSGIHCGLHYCKFTPVLTPVLFLINSDFHA